MFFYTFQMAIGHHVECLKTWNFICRHSREDRRTSPCQIFSKLVYPKQTYCNFSNFQNGRRRLLDFWNRKILLVICVERVDTHQHDKFRPNQSISCEDIKIFRFFKMAAATILDCWIRDILMAYGVWRAQTHHCTKFRQNRSFNCGDIEIFQIFKSGRCRHLGFLKIAKFYSLFGWRRSRRISTINFVKIGQSVVKVLRVFDFSRWRPPPSWIVEFAKF